MYKETLLFVIYIKKIIYIYGNYNTLVIFIDNTKTYAEYIHRFYIDNSDISFYIIY